MAEVIDNNAMNKLVDLGPNVSRAIERRVLRRAAKLVLEQAKRIVPLGDPDDLAKDRKPGELRRSLKIRAGKRRGHEQSITIQSNLPYAKVIEYGHKKPVKRLGKTVPMVRQKYLFLHTAREDVADAVRQEFIDATREELYRLN